MESAFWHKKWETNEIGFHENKANTFLVKYFKELALSSGSRIFLPLCGKSCDITWLSSKGYKVVGAELSQLAVEQFFKENNLEPTISKLGNLLLYRTQNIDIFVGDIFDISSELLGSVDAIYDRAALVALPEEMRKRYVKHLIKITKNKPQLLIAFDYDQKLMPGPPFAILENELHEHYGAYYSLSLIESSDLEEGLKGKCPAKENAWFLQSR